MDIVPFSRLYSVLLQVKSVWINGQEILTGMTPFYNETITWAPVSNACRDALFIYPVLGYHRVGHETGFSFTHLDVTTISAKTLHGLLQGQARRLPDATALWWNGTATRYAELEQRVGRVAARLAAWNPPGRRVAVLAWNCPEFLELIYAVSAAGHILVPLNARLAPPAHMADFRL